MFVRMQPKYEYAIEQFSTMLVKMQLKFEYAIKQANEKISR